MVEPRLEDFSGIAKQNFLHVAASLVKESESILLLAPHEPGFWSNFQNSPEGRDGKPDPMDRWSQRVITSLAQEWGGRAIFPSDGPPFAPFFSWATTSGSCWQSPISLLVHETQGLWISFRGAVILPFSIQKPPLTPSPCDGCAQPCLSACPVNALSGDGYDVSACQQHLRKDDRANCMSRGCAARRACPVSDRYPRCEAQSAYHMDIFCPIS